MANFYQNGDDFGSQADHLSFNNPHHHQQQQQHRHSLPTSNSYDEALDAKQHQHDSYTLSAPPTSTSHHGSNLPSSKRLSTPSDFSPSSSSEFGPDPLNPEHFPTEEVFQTIIDDYLNNLSERKREKALITQEMYDNVLLILQDPRNTSTSTAQFRFWAKKMFAILEYKGEFVVTHDKRPVAVKEQIYDVLVYCHGQASHGGRDKTSSMTREYYSWVPKQLVAEFVKRCPTCLSNRQKHPNFFGEGHAPIVVPRESRNPTRSDPAPPGVPQTVTLTDARDALKTGVLPKATGFFTRHDEDDYAYPGAKRKGSSSKTSSSNGLKVNKNVRRPGQPTRRHSSAEGANEDGHYDELEQHQLQLQKQRQHDRNFLPSDLDYIPPSSVSMLAVDSNGNPIARPTSSTSTLDSPALNTPSYGMYPLPGSTPFLVLPDGHQQRLSVPELYGQQQSCNDFGLGLVRRGSTGGMMGGGEGAGGDLSQMDVADLMRAHQQATSGGYFGAGVGGGSQQHQQQHHNGFNNSFSNEDPYAQAFPSPSSTNNDSSVPTFTEPFPSSSSNGDVASSTLHRAHRPPPLNLNNGSQFQQYRSMMPLDSAGLDSAGGLLSAQQLHHQQRPYLYSPAGLSPTNNSPNTGSLALPLHSGRPSSAYSNASSGGGFADGFGGAPSPALSRPGSAVFRTLGNQVEQLHFPQDQQSGSAGGQMQFAFSVDGGVESGNVVGGQSMGLNDSGVSWGGGADGEFEYDVQYEVEEGKGGEQQVEAVAA